MFSNTPTEYTRQTNFSYPSLAFQRKSFPSFLHLTIFSLGVFRKHTDTEMNVRENNYNSRASFHLGLLKEVMNSAHKTSIGANHAHER